MYAGESPHGRIANTVLANQNAGRWRTVPGPRKAAMRARMSGFLRSVKGGGDCREA
jgi:hypothetical protein